VPEGLLFSTINDGLLKLRILYLYSRKLGIRIHILFPEVSSMCRRRSKNTGCSQKTGNWPLTVKKHATILLPVTVSNVDQFPDFFHRKTQQ